MTGRSTLDGEVLTLESGDTTITLLDREVVEDPAVPAVDRDRVASSQSTWTLLGP